MSRQLRIVAVKYNGQDNDSVIYPRFGPLSVRLFPTLEENTANVSFPLSPPTSVAASLQVLAPFYPANDRQPRARRV